MMKQISLIGVTAALLAACSNGDEATADAGSNASEQETATIAENATAAPAICIGMGPQTPRDISSTAGLNRVMFEIAPPAEEMNLCNIHTHTNAEHKGPGFSVFVNDSDNGGYACNDAGSLTEAELIDPANGSGAFKGVKPGDTIEVHWVHTTCNASPGEGLGACVPDTCTDPLLRVEAQTFLVVNDPAALDFNEFDYTGSANAAGFHQAGSIPSGTGEPVQFRGSTTGPSYTQSSCSPLQVTWAVRPQCSRVDISSLHEWAAKGNVFNETESHGVRQLVTAPELLAPME